MNETALDKEYSTNSRLYLALDLSEAKWKLGFTCALGQSPWIRTIDAGDDRQLVREIERAKQRFELANDCRVMSCYEAGRDGFWLHRYLVAAGVENVVVDAASIEINRRAKRVKTDRLDAGKLVRMLVRYASGEKKVWSVVHVPSLEAEDQRQISREIATLKVDHTRHINRIHGLLAGQGIRLEVQADFLTRLDKLRLWDGTPIPAGLRARLAQEYACLQFVKEQIAAQEAKRRDLLHNSTEGYVEQVRQLMRLKGIGEQSAWRYVTEFFAWRAFRNRREVGALAGLTPTPYGSGDEQHELGISKAGNRLVRAMAIEIAWQWLRFQPESELSQWYWQRFGQGSKRIRKMGIVALARKLLIALWRYLELGQLPAGAQLKA